MTTYKLRDLTTGRCYPHQFKDRSVAEYISVSLAGQTGHHWELETVTDEDRDHQPTDHEEMDLT